MQKDNTKYLHDILSAIELINSFVENTVSFEQYSQDLKTKSAVERQLSIVGEAVIKFSQNEELLHATQIRGFRNRIIHAYDSIDDTIVWVIVKKYLPKLYGEVQEKLSK